MRLLKQLEFAFAPIVAAPGAIVEQARRLPYAKSAGGAPALQFPGRDRALESQARELLRLVGAGKLARDIRVKWNRRLKTAAGHADYCEKLISLNPLLRNHGEDEIDRTLRHELAHLVAQFRVGRRRVLPHGPEWRQACRDFGIADEARCHNLSFVAKTYAPRYLYRCPNCKQEFPRVRRMRRAVACLACCRKYNSGEFDPRFRLRLTKSQQKEAKETKNQI